MGTTVYINVIVANGVPKFVKLTIFTSCNNRNRNQENKNISAYSFEFSGSDAYT
jgi:hypothetical protein